MRRSRLTNVAALSGSAGKTYAEFQAHIATLAVDGSVAQASNMSVAGQYRTTLAAGSDGQMFGSTWSSQFILTISQAKRGIQHGMPSQAVFDAQVSAGREVYFQTSLASGIATVALDRNGYLSETDAASSDGRMIDLIYWDGTAAQRMNPFAGTGPTPYTW